MLAAGGRCILSTPLGAPGQEEDGRSLLTSACTRSNFPALEKKKKRFLMFLFMYICLAAPADGTHYLRAIGIQAALHVAQRSFYAEA